MGIEAHLSIKFEEDISSEKKIELLSSLKRDGWEKSAQLENSWSATFQDGVTDDAAMNVVKHDVDRASKKADFYQFVAFIQLGNNSQKSFKPFKSPAKPPENPIQDREPGR